MKGIYNRKGKKRPPYGEPFLTNFGYTLTIIRIALGQTSRSEIISSINPSTWDNTYRKKLADQKKGIIKEKSETHKHNSKEYIFLWERFFEVIEQQLLQEIERKNQEVLRQAINNLEFIKEPTIDKNKQKFFIKASKKYDKKNSRSLTKELIGLEQEKNKLKEITKDIEAQLNNLQQNITNSTLRTALRNTTNQKNFIICHLLTYFENLLLVKVQPNSIYEEVRTFIFAVALAGEFPTTTNKHIEQYPFNTQTLKQKEIVEQFKRIHQAHNTSLSTLIALKPEFERELAKKIALAEEHMLERQAEYDEFMKKEVEK